MYFNVLANGLPYLMGTERFKGSHSMSGYHSSELCYLAAVYTNLLITKQPMDFYFKPQPGGFKNAMLRVAPDILPPGSVSIGEVWIDDQPYTELRRRQADGQASGERRARCGSRSVSCRSPDAAQRKRWHGERRTQSVRCTSWRSSGELDANTSPVAQQQILPLATPGGRMLLDMTGVTFMSSAGLRLLLTTYREVAARNGKVALAASPTTSRTRWR